MAKSQETYSKKDKEKTRQKKRKEKEEEMAERKANAKKGKSLDEMMAYVDENGNISSTRPDPNKKQKIDASEIHVSVPRLEDRPVYDTTRKGTITFFNQDKGFGFIKDLQTQESVFIHANQLSFAIKEHDKVNFEVEMGHKGPSALNVTKTPV